VEETKKASKVRARKKKKKTEAELGYKGTLETMSMKGNHRGRNFLKKRETKSVRRRRINDTEGVRPNAGSTVQ